MKILKKLLKSNSGNFGSMTALLAVPLIGAVGSAVDYSYVSDVRAKLMVAADAAALGAIVEISNGYALARPEVTPMSIAAAESDGENIFFANASQIVNIRPENVEVTVIRSGETVVSTVSFSANIPTFIMGIFGYNFVRVSGTASATNAADRPSFVDYHLLLDNTPSMGLGATKRDINALINSTKTRCAFACHEVSNNGYINPNSNYMIARKNGITLRIDVLKQAALGLIDRALEIKGGSSRFRFAAYNFGKAALEPGYQIGKLSNLTVDLPSFRKAVGEVALMTTPHSNYNNDALTSFDTALTKIGSEIKVDGGTGRTPDDRKQVVIFVTDGVGNSIKPTGCTGFYSGSRGRCFEPIDVRYCGNLKKRNITIAILYTTYVEVDDHLYSQYVKKFAHEIGPKLKECASEDLYSEVGIEGDMSVALKKLFEKAASPGKLRLAS